jgi:hypothetical protein
MNAALITVANGTEIVGKAGLTYSLALLVI